MEIKLGGILTLLKTISWIKNAQFFVFLLICGMAYGIWENRVVVYNSIKVGARYETQQPLVLNLSNSTRDYINLAAEKTKGIVAGIQVVSVDFKKNSRSTSHFVTTEASLLLSFNEYTDNKVAPTPLFTNSEIENQRVIDLINGEFVCLPFTQTIAGTIFSRAKNITTVCSISIPPYYGRFSGYMNVYLKTSLAGTDLSIVRQLSRDISLRIYETDIDKSAHYLTRQ
jgi:hypothetical protein